MSSSSSGAVLPLARHIFSNIQKVVNYENSTYEKIVFCRQFQVAWTLETTDQRLVQMTKSTHSTECQGCSQNDR